MTDQPFRRAKGLPKIDAAAWHGPIGEAVQRLAPSTEGDPVAMLVCALALFGSVVGAEPHVRVGGVAHPARIWPLLVGRTSAGRKGTAWAESRNFVLSFSPFTRNRIVSGLASGEGLIAALSGEDAKAPDGRLVVIEPEFARVLAAAKRDGSTLAPILRSLFDDGSAAVLTKRDALECRGAHVVFVAHVTPLELRAKLAETEISGGTVNRLLPLLVERTQLLAIEPERPELADLGAQLTKAADLIRDTRTVRRTKAADRLWTEAYHALADDEPDGLLGAVLARGPAYAMRIALTYALADGQRAIDDEHLRAGLAVWQYASDSARILFADLSGVSEFDRLVEYLSRSSGGRTRTEINRDLFKGNKPAAEIDTLLTALIDAGDVQAEEEKPPRGRPTTRYYWLGGKRDTLAAMLAGEPVDGRNEVTNLATVSPLRPLDQWWDA